MLEINHLKVTYQNRPKEQEVSLRPALDDFSLSMQSGQIISLVGESGSGKSTVIRAIAGLLPSSGRISSGEIHLDDQPLQALSAKEWRKRRGHQVAMIFQDSGAMLDPIASIGSQYIEYIRAHEAIRKADARDKAVQMLEQMHLKNAAVIMNKYPFQLSGGMLQRIGIAMAMTYQPRLLLADEPTSALDVTTQARIVEQMLELRQAYGTSILMVTHNLGVAAYMSDHIVIMKDGQIVETGSRDQIIENPQQDYTRALLEAVPDMRGARYV